MEYRQVILTQEADGGFSAEIPSLPGCFSEGDSRAEALANVCEAAELWKESVRAHGEDVPPPDRSLSEVAYVPLRAD